MAVSLEIRIPLYLRVDSGALEGLRTTDANHIQKLPSIGVPLLFLFEEQWLHCISSSLSERPKQCVCQRYRSECFQSKTNPLRRITEFRMSVVVLFDKENKIQSKTKRQDRITESFHDQSAPFITFRHGVYVKTFLVQRKFTSFYTNHGEFNERLAQRCSILFQTFSMVS